MVEKDVEISDTARVNMEAFQHQSNEISDDEIQTWRISHVSSHTGSPWSTPNLFR